ncbi:MAG TPA: erythromycin esterase family protein [Gemmatimonadaceae bacterium]|nr:erythromycin esterase family protein [Gemmatimonadaceae bacterium]
MSALSTGLRKSARALRTRADLDPLMDRIGDSRFVLLGEASHGTSEFYTWRAELTKRLILEKGFTIIGVEGDWPDCFRVNRYAKSREGSGKSAAEVLHAFDRWPTWMWANREVQQFVEWIRSRNQGLSEDQRVGFYGLDVYSLWDSMKAVVDYLGRVDPGAVPNARRAYNCFEPYAEDEQEYARATALIPTSCEDETVAVLAALRAKAPSYREDGREGYFDAEQNALVARNAERYYRAMVRGGPESWNVRDRHMVETLDRLVAHHGATCKAVVWEHNTHIGDARFTDMARHGMVNVGELMRREHGDDGVVIVGFGTHRGTVIAGSEWGAPMQRMRVPAARRGSLEAELLEAGVGDSLLIFDDTDDGGIPGLAEPIGHRAIGVVYDPDHERWGNYVPTIVPGRYDAFIYIEETRALDPLHMPVRVDGLVPETYPTGM